MRTDELIRTIGKARRNARIRAVLLEIDSPGGTAIASEQLYVAVRRLAARKPVVAWIKGTGASGAYFLACGATRVLAFPSAIVGSIGVISVRPVVVDALRRVGARMVVTKTGPFKDLGAPWREPTEEDEAHERELVDAIFQRFTGAVRSARGYDDEALARVTTGEVWLGTRAVELGLIDGLADDEEAALDVAAELAGLPHRLTQRLGGTADDLSAPRGSRRGHGTARRALAHRDGKLDGNSEASRVGQRDRLRLLSRLNSTTIATTRSATSAPIDQTGRQPLRSKRQVATAMFLPARRRRTRPVASRGR